MTDASDDGAARGIAPYVVVLAAAGLLYALAGRIETTATPGRIGPDFWPKAIVILLAVVAAIEIVARLVRGRRRRATQALLQSFVEGAGADEAAGTRVSPRLLAGIALVIGYVAGVGWIGFFLATLAFIFLFIRVGGYRRTLIALAIAVVGATTLIAIFMRLVYVSLPIGVEPFARVSLAVMALLGVR
jgi:putative tricarboxylic transport membrane protein